MPNQIPQAVRLGCAQRFPDVSGGRGALEAGARSLCARCLGGLVLGALAGCATQPPAPVEPQAPEPAPTVRAVEAPEVVWAPFEKAVLLDLLTAEMALRRGDPQRAATLYGQAARATRDPEVVGHAARLAAYLGRTELAVEMAELWMAVEPDAVQAPEVAVEALLRGGDAARAVGFAVDLLARGGESLFGAVAMRGVHDGPDQRAAIIAALEAQRGAHPELDDLAYALALLYRAEARRADAWALLQPLPTDAGLEPEFAMLRVDLLSTEVSQDAAVAELAAHLAEPDASDRLWFLASRYYVDQGLLDGAREAFETLLSRRPGDEDLLLSLALITMQQEDLESSARYLETLWSMGARENTASYYLGEVYLAQGREQDARDAYARVEDGPEFLAAVARWADLERDLGGLAPVRDRLALLRGWRPDDAVDLYLIESGVLVRAEAGPAAVALLDEALAAHPGEPQLLYSRALQLQQLGDTAGMEADLRRLIATEPDNAAALNALGYTLADRNERLDEAWTLIQRAYALEPDDPAVIDSLGWIHYRMGNYGEAVRFLEAAHEVFPDHEVTAHLGEVLWMSGERRRARRLLRNALAEQPDSVVLQQVVERLLGR